MSEHVVVLLHSKYSDACKTLFEIMSSSGIDFSFIKLLGIDNAELRDKIKASDIGITSIPCILNLYRDGRTEKFEGDDAFKYIDSHIAPIREKLEREREYLARQEQLRIQQEQLRIQQEQQRIEMERRKKAEEESEEMAISSKKSFIDNDRHRIVQQPPRIRDSANSYDSSDEYFNAEKPSTTQLPASAIRTNIATSQTPADIHGVASKMKEFAKMREASELEIQKQRATLPSVEE